MANVNTADSPVNDAQLIALSADLGAALKARNCTLTLAESCTGGMLAQTITSVAGSSAWFSTGFVTYSNASKRTLLNVRKHVLTQHGAVSEQTALEMAKGALKVAASIDKTSSTLSPTIIAASITGIAGPDGGTLSKPVGTVCFAFAQASHCFSSTQLFKGDRENIRKQSTEYALKQLLQLTLTIEI